jgi:hypothetical protein
MDDVVRPYATAIRRPSGGSAPARKLLPLIAEAPAVRSILDYGCGYGSDVGFYRANGYHAIGYDCYPPLDTRKGLRNSLIWSRLCTS